MLKCLVVCICAGSMLSIVFCDPGYKEVREKQSTGQHVVPQSKTDWSSRSRRQSLGPHELRLSDNTLIYSTKLITLQTKESSNLTPLKDGSNQGGIYQLKPETNSELVTENSKYIIYGLKTADDSCNVKQDCTRDKYSSPHNFTDNSRRTQESYHDSQNHSYTKQYSLKTENTGPPPPHVQHRSTHTHDYPNPLSSLLQPSPPQLNDYSFKYYNDKSHPSYFESFYNRPPLPPTPYEFMNTPTGIFDGKRTRQSSYYDRRHDNRRPPRQYYDWPQAYHSEPPHQGGPPQHHREPPAQLYYGGQPPHQGGPPTHHGGPPPHHGGTPPYHGGPPPHHGGPPPHHGGSPPHHGGPPPHHGGPPPHHGGLRPHHGGSRPHLGVQPLYQGGGPPPYHTGPPPNHSTQFHHSRPRPPYDGSRPYHEGQTPQHGENSYEDRPYSQRPSMPYDTRNQNYQYPLDEEGQSYNNQDQGQRHTPNRDQPDKSIDETQNINTGYNPNFDIPPANNNEKEEDQYELDVRFMDEVPTLKTIEDKDRRSIVPMNGSKFPSQYQAVAVTPED